MNAMLPQADIRVGTWRLSVAATGDAAVLAAGSEAFQRRLAGMALAPSLVHADPGPHAVVVIDRLRTPALTVDVAGTVLGLGAFEGAFRETIEMALQSAHSMTFPDRPAALLAFARAVARRDETLLWVWRGLNLLPEDAAPGVMSAPAVAGKAMEQLIAGPDELWPTLMALAATGDLQALWHRTDPAVLERLVATLGAPEAAGEAMPSADAVKAARRLILVHAPLLLGLATPDDRDRAVLAARLAALLVAARLPGAVATRSFIAAATELYRAPAPPAGDPDGTATAEEADPLPPSPPARQAGIGRHPASPGQRPTPRAAAEDGDRHPPIHSTADHHDTLPTAYGGLLFLLHLVPASGLFEALARGEMAGLGLHDVLRCIATDGLAVPADDPVVPVFGGLWPGRLAALATARPSARQRRLLVGHARLIEGRLRERLPDLRDPAELLRREGTLEVTPGKAILRLPASSVDTAVRRAGLDLDPGFLPWLGMVVRFSYE